MVSWFPGVLQQLWIDVSVRCPRAQRYTESASKPGVAAVAGETEKTKRYGAAVTSLVFETHGKLGGEGAKLLRDLGEDGGGERAVQPTRCWKMEDPAGASAVVCSCRHLLAGAGVLSCGATCC